MPSTPKPPEAPRLAAPRPDSDAANGKDAAYGWLVGALSDGTELKIPVTKLPFIIGRSIRNDFQLRSPDVSRRHVIIHESHGALTIEDLNSANGTLVNGTRIKSADLEPGDLLQLGSILFKFRLSPDEAPDEDEEDTGTFPELTIPSIDDNQDVRSSGKSDSVARDSRGRFISRVNRSRRKRG